MGGTRDFNKQTLIGFKRGTKLLVVTYNSLIQRPQEAVTATSRAAAALYLPVVIHREVFCPLEGRCGLQVPAYRSRISKELNWKLG